MTSVQDLTSALYRLSMRYVDPQAWSVVVGFCRNRWDIPLVLTATYLGVVYATRNAIPKHPFAAAVDLAFAAWNLALSLFSAWGVWHMSTAIMKALQSEGLYFTVCADTRSMMKYSGDNPTVLALALFCLSKIPELGDTAFLILRRRPVRLLQWYHHATVMLFCWLALATEYTPGVWFAATNYFVHAVMYMYFFLMSFKSMAKIVKPISPMVTIIQIVQMVWGLIVNGIAVGSYFRTGACQIQQVTVYCAVVMYASYFWLFFQLFLDSRRTAKKGGVSVGRALSRRLSQALLDDLDGDGGKSGGDEKKLN